MTHGRSGTRQCLAQRPGHGRQRGDVLLFVLFSVLVLLLAGLYTMRGLIGDTVIAGNAAQRQKNVQMGDAALAQAMKVITDTLDGTDGSVALQIAAAEPRPDLILLDVMMPPGIDGFETCRRLKADPATADIPVIFVTARSDDVATGFAAGGADYITKPIVAGEVRARVHHQLERRGLLQSLRRLNRELEDRVRERTAELTRTNLQLRQEVRERRYMQDRLNYLASHDFVTRLHNRQALDAQVSERLARLQLEAGPPPAHGLANGPVLMLIDIDQFRRVNDSCGCIAGDELLRQFADLLAGLVGREDFLARLGADQFALLAEDHGGDAGAGLARLILAAIERFLF